MVLPRRKKWAEAEERTLIDKYAEMVCDGTLQKMKTREKKFKPIALYVNSVHHVCDSAAYPWQWTWKDVSTKVQNMRHQYLLVKQKIKKPRASNSADVDNEFEWEGGLSHWANFMRYKEVFGDVPASHAGSGNNNNEFVGGALCEKSDCGAALMGSENMLQISEFGQIGKSSGGCFCGEIDGDENRIPSLEMEDNGEEEEDNHDNNYGGDILFHEAHDDSFYGHEHMDADVSDSRKKGKATNGEKRLFGLLSSRLKQLREIEAQVEHNEAERLQKRKRIASIVMEKERERQRKVEQSGKQKLESDKSTDELLRQRMQEWESKEKEREGRERERSGQELILEMESEERIKQKRCEANNRIEGMLHQHQVEMRQIQARILHEQQNLASQLLSVVSEHARTTTTTTTTSGAHYFLQIIQNLLLNVNNLGQGDCGAAGETQDEQFMVGR